MSFQVPSKIARFSVAFSAPKVKSALAALLLLASSSLAFAGTGYSSNAESEILCKFDVSKLNIDDYKHADGILEAYIRQFGSWRISTVEPMGLSTDGTPLWVTRSDNMLVAVRAKTTTYSWAEVGPWNNIKIQISQEGQTTPAVAEYNRKKITGECTIKKLKD